MYNDVDISYTMLSTRYELYVENLSTPSRWEIGLEGGAREDGGGEGRSKRFDRWKRERVPGENFFGPFSAPSTDAVALDSVAARLIPPGRARERNALED